jgi:hypothetical protein
MEPERALLYSQKPNTWLLSHNVCDTQTNSVPTTGECQEDTNYTALTTEII